MFIQVIRGKVVDSDGFQAAGDRWETDLRPGADGFLGATEGTTDDGRFIITARFASPDAAAKNNARPEQGEWFSGFEKTVSDVEFHDCDEVVTMLGGGSNDAGFVQVMVGKIKDRTKFNSLNAKADEVAKVFSEWRPDVLGETIAVHNDGSGYTDIVYFASEAEARAGEKNEPTPEVQALMGDMDEAAEVVEYLDLKKLSLR